MMVNSSASQLEHRSVMLNVSRCYCGKARLSKNVTKWPKSWKTRITHTPTNMEMMTKWEVINHLITTSGLIVILQITLKMFLSISAALFTQTGLRLLISTIYNLSNGDRSNHFKWELSASPAFVCSPSCLHRIIASRVSPRRFIFTVNHFIPLQSQKGCEQQVSKSRLCRQAQYFPPNLDICDSSIHVWNRVVSSWSRPFSSSEAYWTWFYYREVKAGRWKTAASRFFSFFFVTWLFLVSLIVWA